MKTQTDNPSLFIKEISDDHTLMHQRLSRFLQITGATNELKNVVNQPLPDVLFMDEAEFNQQMAEYEANLCTDKMSWQRMGSYGD